MKSQGQRTNHPSVYYRHVLTFLFMIDIVSLIKENTGVDFDGEREIVYSHK